MDKFDAQDKSRWMAGRCIVKDCPMTMVLYVGAGQHLCWLHALKMGLNVDTHGLVVK